LLEGVLVCPGSRSKLVLDGQALVCVDPNCRLKFAVRDEIPIMLIDEAVKLPVEDWGRVMQRHSRDTTTGERKGAD
jgi:uncharacterized protein YbaR (Trm112 family)